MTPFGMELQTSRYLTDQMETGLAETRHLPEPDRITHIKARMSRAYQVARAIEAAIRAGQSPTQFLN